MKPVTLTYKVVDELSVKIDVYLPNAPSVRSLPAVVYFHGGGLIVGSRKDMFPTWLQTRVNSAVHIFISSDYRLIPNGSVTGHEVLEDIKDLFAFLRGPDLDFHEHGENFRLDPRKIAVAGSSAGGLCSYLAAYHVEPKPVAVLSIFGGGGDFLSPWYTTPKTEPFVRGRPLIDMSLFKDYIYPFSSTFSSQILSESSMSYVPNTSPPIPADPRMALIFVYLQLGKYLDYYTGQHEPSFDPSAIPERHRGLFPQLNVNSSWPPTYLLHGDEDTAALIDESKNIHRLLTDAGVSSTLKIVPGQDHFFDLRTENAESVFCEYFDDAAGFLKKHL